MADLTIEYYWMCATARHVRYPIEGSKGNKYMVEYDHQRGWTCQCKGFQMRKKCRHIKEAQEKHCGWHQWSHGKDAVEVSVDDDHPNGFACPNCGGEVESQAWGV
jgi:transcription initiation factor IIE alpha subunit